MTDQLAVFDRHTATLNDVYPGSLRLACCLVVSNPGLHPDRFHVVTGERLCYNFRHFLARPENLDEFSDQLSETDFFLGDNPNQSIFRNYRQWAFESAALDLALKQAETSLADRVLDWLDRNPKLEFKFDPTSEWTTEVVVLSLIPPD